MTTTAGRPDSSPTPDPDDQVLGWSLHEPERSDGSTLTDGELLDLCRSGDQHSWSVLVRRYSALVTAVATEAGLAAEDARDVAQSAFVALLESGTRIRQDERIASWLITVTQRLAWRVRRLSDRERLIDDLPAPTDQVSDPQDEWNQVVVLHTALDRLGSPCRDLLWALYFDPAAPSYAEIAAGLGRAIGTIGPTRARCLLKLRTILGDSW